MHLTFSHHLLALLAFTHHAASWGSLGHRTVAYLASLHLSPSATRWTNHLLNGQDISEAALFPDKIAHMPLFSYTRAWHYIDARDNPPHQCGINMTRDCLVAQGCVVSAIANHTARAMDAELPRFFRGQSLRFVLHFVGDVHQPLHTEMEDRGGNGIEVVFDGKRSNLHSVWDTLVPNKWRNREEWGGGGRDSEEEAAFLWAQELFDLDSEKGTSVRDECVSDAADCALEWADEANALVCEYVLKDDVEGVQGMDLAGEYYDGATAIVDSQIRKAGRRLAAWVELMAKKDAEKTRKLVLQA
jgi:hypothetical protein